MGVYDPGFDPGEELGQMDHDELLEEVIKLRAERQKPMSELLEVRHDAPVKIVSKEEYRLAWRVLAPVLRFGAEEFAKDGRDVIWCPGEKCWWELK